MTAQTHNTPQARPASSSQDRRTVLDHVIIADMSLRGYAGHSFEYARSVKQSLIEAGLTVDVLANLNVKQEVISQLGAVPFFHYDLDQYIPPLFPLLSRSQGFRSEANWYCTNRALLANLKKMPPQMPLGPRTLILFHTIRHTHLMSILRWVEQLGESKAPRIALVFHFTAYPDFSQPSQTANYYQRAFCAIEKSKMRSRFTLFADSTELIEEYRQYTNLPVHLLPIPHATHDVELNPNAIDPNAQPTSAPQAAALRLCYLGDARLNKGFDLLPPMVQNVEDVGPLPRSLVYEIQSNYQSQVGDWETPMLIESLRKPNVILHDKPLTSNEYYKLLHRSDIVMLPYTTCYYHSQTSGVFSEAVAACKPVIVSRGTWMARQLKTSASGVTFLPGDFASFIDAVRYATINYDQLRDRAQAMGPRWSDFHSPASYVSTLLDAVGND